MEHEPDYDNVVFIDEYPHLTDRRRVRQMLGQLTLNLNLDPGQLLLFPDPAQTPSAEGDHQL